MRAGGRGRALTSADGRGRTRTAADGRGRARTAADGRGRARTGADGRGRARTAADGGNGRARRAGERTNDSKDNFVLLCGFKMVVKICKFGL